jgi:hypothetical protein
LRAEWLPKQKKLKLNLAKAMMSGDPRKLRAGLAQVSAEYGTGGAKQLADGEEEADDDDDEDALATVAEGAEEEKDDDEEAEGAKEGGEKAAGEGSRAVQGMEGEILSAVAAFDEWVTVLRDLAAATKRSVAKNGPDEEADDDEENSSSAGEAKAGSSGGGGDGGGGDGSGGGGAETGEGVDKKRMQHNSRDVGELRGLLLRAASAGVHVELVAVHDAREQLARAETELTAAEAPLQLQIARLLRRSKETAKAQATKLAKSVTTRQLALVEALHGRMTAWLAEQADTGAAQAEQTEQVAVEARADRLAYQRVQSGRQSLGTHWRIARRKLETADELKVKARAKKKLQACLEEDEEVLIAAVGLAGLTAAGAAAFAGEMAAEAVLHSCQAKTKAAAKAIAARVQSEEQVRRGLEVAAAKAGREAEDDAKWYSKQTTKWQRKMVHDLVIALSLGEGGAGAEAMESRAEDDMLRVAEATAGSKKMAAEQINLYVKKEQKRAADLRRITVKQVAEWMAEQTAKAEAMMRGPKAASKSSEQNFRVQKIADLNQHGSVLAAVEEKAAVGESQACVEEEKVAHEATFKELMVVIEERFRLTEKQKRQERQRRLADMVEVLVKVTEEQEVEIQEEEEVCVLAACVLLHSSFLRWRTCCRRKPTCLSYTHHLCMASYAHRLPTRIRLPLYGHRICIPSPVHAAPRSKSMTSKRMTG